MQELFQQSYTYNPDLPSTSTFENNSHIRHYLSAKYLFERAVRQGRLYRFWAAITRRPHELLEIDSLKSKMLAVSAHHSGLMDVPLDQIIGSEQGNSNFDLHFHPVSERLRDRWIGVATASIAMLQLPAVELIQIGKNFFVRDGHHRISVARALKLDSIEAQVTTWGYSWKHSSETVVDLRAYSLAEL